VNAVDDASAADYAGLVLPGGTVTPVGAICSIFGASLLQAHQVPIFEHAKAGATGHGVGNVHHMAGKPC
jgi:hypothetical protein